MLTAVEPTEGMALLTALDPREDMSMLTAPDLAEGTPMLTALDPMECMVFLTASDPTEGIPVASWTTPDPTAGPVEVDRLSVLGSTGDGLNRSPLANHHVRATRTSPETLETRIPTSRTTPKETSSRPTTIRCLSNDKSYCPSAVHTNLSCMSTSSLNHSRLSALGSAEEWHLNLCPSYYSYYVLGGAGPLEKDGS